MYHNKIESDELLRISVPSCEYPVKTWKMSEYIQQVQQEKCLVRNNRGNLSIQ